MNNRQLPRRFRLTDVPAWVQVGVVIAVGVAFAARTEARVATLETNQRDLPQLIADVASIRATVDVTAHRVESIDNQLAQQANDDREQRFLDRPRL